MEKIKVALKALQLEQTLLDLVTSIDAEQMIVDELTGLPILSRAGKPILRADAYVDNLRDLLEDEEEKISLMFDWVQMGMPQLPHEAFQDERGVAGCRLS